MENDLEAPRERRALKDLTGESYRVLRVGNQREPMWSQLEMLTKSKRLKGHRQGRIVALCPGDGKQTGSNKCPHLLVRRLSYT